MSATAQKSRTESQVRVVPTDKPVGADIVGVNLSQLTDADFEVIFEVWMKHNVLRFRGQDLTKDQLLANITLYWVTRTATSSTRLYWEARRSGRESLPQAYIAAPTGIACYPAEVTKVPRAWVERRYNVTHWTEQPRGGHFAAMEAPDLFVGDVREFFSKLR